MSFIYTNYILKCDLLYKYQQKDIYNFVNVESLTLSLSISDILKYSEHYSSNTFNLNIAQINSFFFSYLFFLVCPYIKVKIFTRDQIEENKIFLKFLFCGNLSEFFLYEKSLDFYYELNNFILSKCFKILHFKEKFDLISKLNFINFYELNYFLKNTLNLQNNKDLNFLINLKMKNK